MRRTTKLTHEEYIEACKEVHNDFYNYENTQYINSRMKVEIECPIHGLFLQKAEGHKSGMGCPECGHAKKSRGAKPTTSLESFIENSREVHGEKYDYSEVQYTRVVDKVAIRCKQHGIFYQMPSSHTKGKGCNLCANEKRNEGRKLTVEESLARCAEVHGGKYDYSAVTKVGDRTKMPILCKVHQQVFHQTTGNHMQGQGCPLCSETGYRVNKPGTLYVLSCDNILKVGITNRPVRTRVKQINKSSGKKFAELFTTYSVDGKFIADLEAACLKYFRSKYKSVEEKFDGSTECFLDVSTADVIQFILPRLHETPESEQSDQSL